MAADERLTALKKAYADIILNTAKEAAARIMLSERKAQRFQKELEVAKDEALRMLLRLKEMMDSKITEAELASLSQQRKIEELEAQLQEAEDIVKDLREELREVQSELERVRNRKLEHMDERHAVSLGEISEDNRFNSSDSVMFPPPESEFEYVAAADSRNLNQFQRNECFDFYRTAPNISNMYIGYPDLPSIILRSKEPELYRNGCTQRIRAAEGNLLGSELSGPGQRNKTKDGISARENDSVKELFTAPTYGTENLRNFKKKAAEADNQLNGWQHIQSFCVKRKRANRHRKNRITSSRNFPGQTLKTTQEPDTSRMSAHTIPIKTDVHSDRNASQVAQRLSSDKPDPVLLASCTEVSESKAELVECTVQHPVTEEKDTEKFMDVRQETGSVKKMVNPVGELDFDEVDVFPLESESKESNVGPASPSQPINERIFKFTFQRKRKKESLTESNGSASLENENFKRLALDKQNSALEQEKSNLLTESTRDSRRLAQVARQLISLSEKKWWQ